MSPPCEDIVLPFSRAALFHAGLTRPAAEALMDQVFVAAFSTDDFNDIHNLWVVWRSWFWLEQGRAGWIYHNWGNIHANSCQPRTNVEGHRGPEPIRAFRSDEEGMRASVLQAVAHLGSRTMPAAVRADVMRGLTDPGYTMPVYAAAGRRYWVSGAWPAYRVSRRILGVTDRDALTVEVARDGDPSRWIATLAHEVGHLALASAGHRNELPGEEQFLERVSRAIEAQINKHGIGSAVALKG